jgi:glycosyltransferase involved in cell wall biosynthesis
MKLACVVHRFGADIAGGSEGHCRLVTEHLAASHDVTIITTCARDHVTWRNHYPPGPSRVGRVPVIRFPVARSRNLLRFREISDHVFANRASPEEQEQWFRENGPEAPAMLEFLERQAGEFDLVMFWSYRYYHSYFGVPLVGRRAVLVPTAEADPLIYAGVLRRLFALPSAYVFLTPEEAELLGDRVPAGVPNAIIGCGIGPPIERPPGQPPATGGALRGVNLADPYVLYLGRIDPNKGCETLLRHYLRYVDPASPGRAGKAPPLVMAGPANMPVPEHPLIRQLGLVDEATRDALLANARVLLMPSPFESLSMVLLEAWNQGLPALVNAKCAVLKGQVLRADGGLYYRTGPEFAGALDYLLDHPEVARRLGAQGRAHVDREYRWPTVMARLEALLERARESVTGSSGSANR